MGHRNGGSHVWLIQTAIAIMTTLVIMAWMDTKMDELGVKLQEMILAAPHQN